MTHMSNAQAAAVMGIIFALVMGIVLFRRRADVLAGFALRILCGAACIYTVNYVMLRVGYKWTLGLNPVTLLTPGFLGIPGLIALYGIKIVSVL